MHLVLGQIEVELLIDVDRNLQQGQGVQVKVVDKGGVLRDVFGGDVGGFKDDFLDGGFDGFVVDDVLLAA